MRWARRLVKVVIIVEVAWLVVINGLLFLPLTQSVVNMIRPEKFHVTWERAWSWYPARVHVRGASANGNSRTQIWQVDVGSASGSIALLPLIIKRVWVSGVEGEDVHFRMRPRIKPDRDYSQIEAYFPEIEGREVTPAITTPRKKKRPWHIDVEGIRVSGEHSYWIYQVQGAATGQIEADLEYRSPGGPLELDAHDIALELAPHYVNGDQEMFQQGRIGGSMGFAPFMPRENKGLPMLNYLLTDLELEIDVNSLRFINLFLLNFKGMNVDGQGLVSGRLHFEKGYVMDGTDLSIDARDLQVDLLAHQIRGKGDVDLKMGPETGGKMELEFLYRDLRLLHKEEQSPLLTGEGLVLRVGGDGKTIPDLKNLNPTREISLEIDSLTAPDLSAYQRYLPKKWPFKLYGGSGVLQGGIRLTPTAYSIDLALKSDAADMGAAEYRFETNLDAAIKFDNPSLLEGGTRVDGSYLRLTGAHLLKDGQKDPGGWSASFELHDGVFDLIGRSARDGDDNLVDLFKVLSNREMRQLLASSDGSFDFTAEVSSLAWLAIFLGESYHARSGGNALIEGLAVLQQGYPAPGTDITISSREMLFNFLQYAARGEGLIALVVEEGGDNPDWRLKVELSEADLRRRQEGQSYIQDVAMSLEALVRDVTLEPDRKRDFALDFRIPSARVTDMSVFNAHLPPDSPIRFSGGDADLGAEILLQTDSADGYVSLSGDDVQLESEEQEFLADLDVEVTLNGGTPAEMKFDIAGSKVVLDNVRVAGRQESFDSEAWSAVLTLVRGDTVFTQPAQLDLEATLSASDSRPIVALFRNQEGWRPEFLANAMTIEDIEGTAELTMRDKRLLIPSAWVDSDNLQVGAKGVIEADGNDGVIYLNYKKLDLLLKINDGKKNVDIIRAREKYDEYRVEQ